jgi:hypothetical protein
VEAGTAAPAQEGSGYSGAAVAGAVLATLFFPPIALIAALLLLGGQADPVKRRSLRTWAWSSAAWLVVPAVIVIALFARGGDSTSRIDRSGPCVGGPQLGAEGRDVSGNGTKFVVPCSTSGTATVTFPNKSH